MKLTEKHIINKNNPHFAECDRVCFLSKNLYNQALYRVRQSYFENKYKNYNAIQKELQNEMQQDYRALPTKVSQQTLMLLDKNWKSYFEAKKQYKIKPDAFFGKPSIPSYKNKKKGRFATKYTIQAINKRKLIKGVVSLSGTTIEIETRKQNICEARIIPRYGCYVIEIVYEVKPLPQKTDNNRYAAIDIGLNNLATIATNIGDGLIINGKPLKSINHYFNKKKAALMSHIGNKGTSNRIEKLTQKRNRKVDHYLHNASRWIVNYLVSQQINTLIVGKNDQWKQSISIGKRNNQNFVSIPHARFISMLKYKCELEGISFKLTEESYTSKCSFLDNEPIQKHEKYLGRRIKRGLFKSSTGKLINADLQGGYNIGRKVIPKAFNVDRIKGVVVHPSRFTPCKQAA